MGKNLEQGKDRSRKVRGEITAGMTEHCIRVLFRVAYRLWSNRLIQQRLPTKGNSRIQSLFSSRGWISLQVFSTCQNTEEAGSTVNEGMDSPAGAREEHAGKEQVLPSSFHIHHKGYHQKVKPRFMVDLPTVNDLGSRVGLPTSHYLIEKNSSQVYPVTWVLVNSKYSQSDSQEPV